MDLKGEQQLSGTPEQIWELLLDPETLASIMPGCDSLEQVGEDVYKGSIKARIGPLSSQYDTRFIIKDKTPPHSYRLLMDGQGPGGFVRGDTLIELKPNDAGTLLHYSGSAVVGGRIASIGQRLAETGARMIIEQGFEAFKEEVERQIG